VGTSVYNRGTEITGSVSAISGDGLSAIVEIPSGWQSEFPISSLEVDGSQDDINSSSGSQGSYQGDVAGKAQRSPLQRPRCTMPAGETLRVKARARGIWRPG